MRCFSNGFREVSYGKFILIGLFVFKIIEDCKKNKKVSGGFSFRGKIRDSIVRFRLRVSFSFGMFCIKIVVFIIFYFSFFDEVVGFVVGVGIRFSG